MRARVLGSAAGGGFPRWDCSCPNCGAIRRGDRRLLARTHDSLAVFARDDAAVICNAAPELAQQIEQTPGLHPRGAHHTPIAAIVLTDGELEHVLGLLALRGPQPLAIYATAAVQRALVERDAIAALLERSGARPAWRTLELGREHELADARGEPTGVRVQPFAVRTAAEAPSDEHVGLVLRGRERSIVYAPCAAELPPGLCDETDVLLLDGTSWPAMTGPHGSLVQLAGCRARRKIYTHLDHENPVLALGSPERRELERVGWIVAHDGMEILA